MIKKCPVYHYKGHSRITFLINTLAVKNKIYTNIINNLRFVNYLYHFLYQMEDQL